MNRPERDDHELVTANSEDPALAKLRSLPTGRPLTPRELAALEQSKADVARGVRGIGTDDLIARAKRVHERIHGAVERAKKRTRKEELHPGIFIEFMDTVVPGWCDELAQHATTEQAQIAIGDVFERSDLPGIGYEVTEQIARDLYRVRSGHEDRLVRGRWLLEGREWVRGRAI